MSPIALRTLQRAIDLDLHMTNHSVCVQYSVTPLVLNVRTIAEKMAPFCGVVSAVVAVLVLAEKAAAQTR